MAGVQHDGEGDGDLLAGSAGVFAESAKTEEEEECCVDHRTMERMWVERHRVAPNPDGVMVVSEGI